MIELILAIAVVLLTANSGFAYWISWNLWKAQRNNQGHLAVHNQRFRHLEAKVEALAELVSKTRQ